MYVINMNMIMNNRRVKAPKLQITKQEYILVICIKTKRINSNQTFKYGRKGKVWLPAEGHIRCTLNI